ARRTRLRLSENSARKPRSSRKIDNDLSTPTARSRTCSAALRSLHAAFAAFPARFPALRKRRRASCKCCREFGRCRRGNTRRNLFKNLPGRSLPFAGGPALLTGHLCAGVYRRRFIGTLV